MTAATLMVARLGAGALVVVGGLVVRGWTRNRQIRRALEEEAALGILPREHVAAIASFRTGRLSSAWPDRRERRIYVRVARRLAVRKAALARFPEERRRIAMLEVMRLRERIRAMLRHEEAEDSSARSQPFEQAPAKEGAG